MGLGAGAQPSAAAFSHGDNMNAWLRTSTIGGVSGLAASLVVLALQQAGVADPVGPHPQLAIGLLSAAVVAAEMLFQKSKH